MQELKIYRDEGIVNHLIIEDQEQLLGFKFPKVYKELLSQHNGMRLDNDTFKYYDKALQRDEENSIYFYAFANQNLDRLYCSGLVGDFSYLDENDFKEGIIPFGGTGNGDFICFDYRDNKKSDNPKIVLVRHDADDENGNLIISLLGNSFEEFMDSLYEYEEKNDYQN